MTNYLDDFVPKLKKLLSDGLAWMKPAAKKPMPVRRFAKNETGRDFVVGDLHGMFAILKKLMKTVNFDPAKDRLFSLGDLIDRGMTPEDAKQWWGKPWFQAIMGNHEDMLINRKKHASVWFANGGGWWFKIPEGKQPEYDECVKQLPTVLEIETNDGKVGLVHADIEGDHWGKFVASVESDHPEVRRVALWSRSRIHKFQRMGVESTVAEIDHVYIGHTVVDDVVDVGNVHFIDTGACFYNHPDAKLTLMQIHPEVKKFQLGTHVPKKVR
jgi:serine/threonine protein phosphatase 1